MVITVILAPVSAVTAPAESTRDRLVEAAAQVFAERGYDGARVQEIVRRAGLTTGAIYGNFRGKADLLLAAIDTAPLDALFASLGTADNAAEGLRVAGHLLSAAHSRDRSLLFEALVAARRDAEVAALLRQRVLERRALLADVIASGQVDGSFDDDIEVDAAAQFCQALGMGFLLMEAVGLPRPDERGWGALIDRVVGAMAPTAPVRLTKETSAGNQ